MAGIYDKLKQFSQTNTVGKKEELSSAPSSSASKIPEKLLNIPGVVSGSQLIGALENRDNNKKEFLESIGVENTENAAGSYGFKQTIYDSNHLLYPPGDLSLSELSKQAKDEAFQDVTIEKILFIDTETTGLAGGTGTLPFLIGIGYFDKSGFCVDQYLMRDYDEEPAVLYALRSIFEQADALVTYNGKCFDIPVLHSRFLINRSRFAFDHFPHLDLLHPARRFWKHSLPDCRLSTLESHLFNHQRAEDIPGELIPYVYFDFLRGIRIPRMKPVLAHNVEDIFSLAMLTAKTCRMLKNPMSEIRNAYELIGVARYYQDDGNLDQACQCFEEAIGSNELTWNHKYQVYRHLSLLYKRQRLFSQAKFIWLKMIEEFHDCFAYIELAKHFEHRARQLDKALEHTEKAITLVNMLSTQGKVNHNVLKFKEKLYHRRQRLFKKLGIDPKS